MVKIHNKLTFFSKIWNFTDPEKEGILGIGDNAGHLLFPFFPLFSWIFFMRRKNCGKWKKCWLLAFTPFPKFSKASFSTSLTLSQTRFFTLPYWKEFADNSFRFDENVRKFSKRVENIVGQGEIAHYEQFLLFPQCFKKVCTADT